MDLKATLLCILFVCSPSHAQEPFRIEGEQTVTVQSPFLVHAEKPGVRFDIYDWDRSADVQLKPQGLGANEVTAPQGQHWVSCTAYSIVWDEERVEQVNFFLEFVVGTVTSDPEDPDEPPDDGGDMSEAGDIAKAAATQLNDRPTQTIIRAAINRFLSTAQPATDLETLKRNCDREIQEAFLIAMRESQADWFNGFRVPLNNWLSENVKTSANYIAAMTSTAHGLAPPTTMRGVRRPAIKRITIWSLPNDQCTNCVKWKREEAPKFRQAGYEVAGMISTKGAFPRFMIESNGQQITTGLYLDVARFNHLMRTK